MNNIERIEDCTDALSRYAVQRDTVTGRKLTCDEATSKIKRHLNATYEVAMLESERSDMIEIMTTLIDVIEQIDYDYEPGLRT